MKKLILLLLLNGCLFAQNQDYELINQIFCDSSRIRVLRADFEPLKNATATLNEDFFKNSWAFIKTANTPDIDIFLNNFNIRNISSVLLEKDDLINKTKLCDQLRVVDSNMAKGDYTVISTPVFNEAKDWALMYSFGVWTLDVGSSGVILILRKCGKKWSVYHKIEVWIS